MLSGYRDTSLHPHHTSQAPSTRGVDSANPTNQRNMAAAASFISLPLPPNPSPLLRSSSSRAQRRSPATFKTSSISCSAAPPSSSAAPPKPQIELDFIGPKDGDVAQASAVSGDKLLRSIMLENKIELYALYGKLMNCGGGGSCGTCIVEIIDGKDLLNERTDTEKRYLKKKPESWRLACQTIVGNKENSGKVIVRRLPQSR